GLEVVEVNIAIDDVRLPDDEDSSASAGDQSRVA
ncbi:Asp23/Gls24 family envelope stress response protein, partial [Streptomyces sp. SID7982]|nr:Asp23/Gls24 family envelope stress response protein [Streptomyces sp. SID7982]